MEVPVPAHAQAQEAAGGFHIPTQSEFIADLAKLNSIEAIVLVAIGLVFLLQGYKLFKILVTANAGILGAMVGEHFGSMQQGTNMPLFGAIAGGLLCAALAWPLMKYAVSLMSALTGATLGFGLWNYIVNILGKPELGQHSWAGAMVGAITLGLLAFIAFKTVVMIFTSVQGSVMSMSGLLALLLNYQQISPDLHNALSTNRHLLPLLMIIPAVIGYALQHTGGGGKKKGGEAKS